MMMMMMMANFVEIISVLWEHREYILSTFFKLILKMPVCQNYWLKFILLFSK
jgi:hypothetical protein